MNIEKASYQSACPGCGKPSGEVSVFRIPTSGKVHGFAGKGMEQPWQQIPDGWLFRARIDAQGRPVAQAACSWECAARCQERERAEEAPRIIDPRALGWKGDVG